MVAASAALAALGTAIGLWAERGWSRPVLPAVTHREYIRITIFHGRLTSPPTPAIPSPTPTDTAWAALRSD